jgi:hypothetical protein
LREIDGADRVVITGQFDAVAGAAGRGDNQTGRGDGLAAATALPKAAAQVEGDADRRIQWTVDRQNACGTVLDRKRAAGNTGRKI